MADRNVKVTIEVIDKAKQGLASISSQTKKASAELKRMDVDTKNAKNSLGAFGTSLGNLAKVAGTLFAAGTLVNFLKGAATEAMEAEQNIAQLNAVLRSTSGAAGVSSEAALELANSLSKQTTFTDDAVLSAENLLLTFTAINKDIFPEATATVLDMSTALGQDLKSSAVQLGKALQDPILGVTALRRVGVNFNESQQEVIKNLVETGRVAEAQRMILDELSREFGGSAQAAALTYAGKLQQARNSMAELQETIGTYMLPTLTLFSESLIFGANALFGFADASDEAAQKGGVEFARKIQVGALALGNLAEQWISLENVMNIGKVAAGFTTLNFGLVTDGIEGIKDSYDDATNSLSEDLTNIESLWTEQDAAAEKNKARLAELQTELDSLGSGYVSMSDDAERSLEKLETGYHDIVSASDQFVFETVDDFVKFQNAITETGETNEDYISTAKAGFRELQGAISDTGSEITKLEDDLRKAQQAFDDFVSSSTEQASSDFARIIVEAEQKLPELRRQLSDAQSDGGNSDRISDLRKQIQEQKDILKTAKTAEIEDFAGLQEELKFLREQGGRNELEQALAVFERKMEAKKKEFEAEKKQIEDTIKARQDELAAMQTIQIQMSNLLEQNVNRRLGKVKEETSALYGQVTALNALATAYSTLAAIQSGSGTSTKTSGRREMGGAVSAGKSYLVGESGPETFTPNRSGVIDSSKGKSITVNVNNPVVRDDRDIRTIANAVRDILSREEELTQFGAN